MIIALLALAAILTPRPLLIAQPSRDADFDANGIVDFGDFILFAQAFGSNQSTFDLNGSGSVDFPDFILFAQQFGEGAPEKEITVTLPGGANLEMVWIQPGRFLMGSPASESGRRDDEGPQHEVTITKGFYLGKYEVTQVQWERVMNTRPWTRFGASEDPKKANYPATSVGWKDVETFIRRSNEAEGKEIYRLPTEAEWEYACRAGTTTPWSFGDDSTRVGDYARYYENSRTATVQDDGRVVYGPPEAQETGVYFRTPGACTICMEMYGSWCMISLDHILESTRPIPRGPTCRLVVKLRNVAMLKEEEPISTALRGYGRPCDLADGRQTIAAAFAC